MVDLVDGDAVPVPLVSITAPPCRTPRSFGYARPQNPFFTVRGITSLIRPPDSRDERDLRDTALVLVHMLYPTPPSPGITPTLFVSSATENHVSSAREISEPIRFVLRSGATKLEQESTEPCGWEEMTSSAPSRFHSCARFSKGPDYSAICG